MLRRNSSKNKQRRPLSRSKSTSPIARNPVDNLQSIDPAVAARDAQIAAVVSYQRGQQRNSIGMTSYAGGLIAERSSSRYAVDQSHICGRQEDSRRPPSLKRQQSIRFAGSSAGPSRYRASRTSETEFSPSSAVSRHNGSRDDRSRPTGSVLSEAQENTYHSSPRRSFYDQGVSYEYYTPEDDIASMPSSYRRLRRCKSMVVPARLGSAVYNFDQNSSETRRHFPLPSRYSFLNKENRQCPNVTPSASDLRAPKSMSYLRTRRDPASSIMSSYNDDKEVSRLVVPKRGDDAQNSSRLSSRPSLFFRSKNRGTESSGGMRKSLRSSSNNTTVSSAFTGDVISVDRPNGLRHKARKVSQTLKHTLKGLFGPSKNSEVEVSGSINSDTESQSHKKELTGPDEVVISRGPSRIASLHQVAPSQHVRSRHASVNNAVGVHFDNAEDKSRVTSWTDSVTNTAASQSGTGEWERQRLSIIEESGLHVPALTQSALGTENASTHLSGPVDSQRMYSALMKRLQEVKAGDGGRNVGEPRMLGLLPPRSSSLERVASGGQVYPSIRCVRADDDVFKGADPDNAWNTDQSHNILTQSTKATAPSEQDRAEPLSNAERTKTITHRTSAFFASPSSHLFRTTSPYRRAIQRSMHSSDEPMQLTSPGTDAGYMCSLSALSLPSRRPSTAASEKYVHTENAESLYSEDGKHLSENGAVASTEVFGDSAIFNLDRCVTMASKLQETEQATPSSRGVSNTSSMEWKTRLSSKFSRIETPRTSDKRGLEKGNPNLGHVREVAEIESPSEGTSPDGKALSNVEGLSRPQVSQRPALIRDLEYSGSERQGSLSARGSPDLKLPIVAQRGELRPAPSLPSIRMGDRKGEMWGHIEDITLSPSVNALNLRKSATREELLKRRQTRMRLAAGGALSSNSSSPKKMPRVDKFDTGSPAQKTGFGATGASPSPSTIWARPRQLENQDRENNVPELTPGGSKKMVDQFLHSRRRGIVGSNLSTEGEVEGSSPAFL